MTLHKHHGWHTFKGWLKGVGNTTANLLKLSFFATLYLTIMKYLGFVPWSWWLVTSPMWVWLLPLIVLTGLLLADWAACKLFGG